ncbi:MAG: hypothetical protein PHG88_08215 [Limnochordia bacterium]|nr:hypothetical protein [Limnochordia bacterium]
MSLPRKLLVRALLCLHLALLFSSVPAAAGSPGETAHLIHGQAWLDTAGQALENPAYKYAIYQSRSLAVKHPELYLQADALFNEVLTSRPNMIKFYRNRTQDPQRQWEEYRAILLSRNVEFFRWSEFSSAEHNPVSCRELYGSAAFLPFVDLRLHFMASALKGADWQATPLSMAEFLYFQHGAGKDSFIIVTADGTAYLYKASTPTSPAELFTYSGEPCRELEGDAVLIFNQEYVWYPLMGRDDRLESPALAEAVASCAQEGFIPELTALEAELVEILKESTKLHSQEDRLLALACAAKLHTASWRLHPELFQQLDPFWAEMAGFSRNQAPDPLGWRGARITLLSNRLCPVAAELAAVARENSSRGLKALMDSMVQEYFRRLGPSSSPRPLTLWYHSDLYLLNLDDYLLARAGSDLSTALATAAMLDLADIPGLEVYVVGARFEYDLGSHAYCALFLGEERGIAAYGQWLPEANGLFDPAVAAQTGLALSALLTPRGWVNFATDDDLDFRPVSSSLEADSILQLLQVVSRKTQGQARIATGYSRELLQATGIYDVERFISEFPALPLQRYPF